MHLQNNGSQQPHDVVYFLKSGPAGMEKEMRPAENG